MLEQTCIIFPEQHQKLKAVWFWWRALVMPLCVHQCVQTLILRVLLTRPLQTNPRTFPKFEWGGNFRAASRRKSLTAGSVLLLTTVREGRGHSSQHTYTKKKKLPVWNLKVALKRWTLPCCGLDMTVFISTSDVFVIYQVPFNSQFLQDFASPVVFEIKLFFFKQNKHFAMSYVSF